ncbi:hypothetical protein OX283_012110 [Flavobacterium sp. SUN052]|uniref:hypothetical protein n=1 Tax=Flavobacterium sp. SUN052 TaxID=3002441 RepID=UPI00237E9719|nr:hypothetical protein [Flavobacterium sp. SUN052]MEC4005404.1 hypothetical protein [Flavobacterium sp. SUN052]
MKNNLRLKSLIAFSLLIFMMPFLQTCSDKAIRKHLCIQADEVNSEFETKISKIGEIEKNKAIVQSKKSKEECQSCLDKTKKENTFNLYQLGFVHYDEFESRYLTDKTFYIFLNFTIIILLTFSMLILSFKRKFKRIIIISLISLILLIIATISLCLIGVIENLNQIKYGYYFFIVNSILIIIQCRLEKTDYKKY